MPFCAVLSHACILVGYIIVLLSFRDYSSGSFFVDDVNFKKFLLVSCYNHRSNTVTSRFNYFSQSLVVQNHFP